MRQPRGRLAALALGVALTGCYRIATPGPAQPTVDGGSRTMNTIAWGAFNDDGLDAICGGHGAIAEVTATTPPLAVLETVLTLGIWAPMYVETRCLANGVRDAKK